MFSLFSLLLSSYKNQVTQAWDIFVHGQYEGQLYIQKGSPLSCLYQDLNGQDALDLLYRHQREGIEIEFRELDTLNIYSENIKEHNFEKLMMQLLEKQKLRKVFRNYSRRGSEEVSYWQ
jgi:hypothetical protein